MIGRLSLAALSLAAVLIAAAVGAATAQSSAIAARQETFRKMDGVSRDLGRMLRGGGGFDLAKVQAGLRTISESATALQNLFPDDSKGAPSKARPELWDNKQQVIAAFAKLGADATAAQAAITDEASFRSEFPGVQGNCSACHRNYRGR